MREEMFAQEKTIPNNAAIYQIRLKGTITTTLIQMTDDMQVRQETDSDIISLIGWLPDQSALMGLLNTLHDIHFTIKSVQIIKQ
ncbi:hypothetical protein J1N10_19525 [Carboxylicivirga sp. A043]|uniref:Uncharacterized protein n=1 Tax=Carboxylicivirga linearis TaxID=1628157 RepID=A0ABS5K3H7_9BACT|nr:MULTISPECIES: hypothetical protein [Carboxylicivirga]MBS2101109.1 hypothetical protein [Carboxylicivirga linearis]MCU4158174.1 hypothetical protein [Carboxylicivirga sp. A043]